MNGYCPPESLLLCEQDLKVLLREQSELDSDWNHHKIWRKFVEDSKIRFLEEDRINISFKYITSTLSTNMIWVVHHELSKENGYKCGNLRIE